MQRNIYLQGELAERFGRKFVVNTENYSDIMIFKWIIFVLKTQNLLKTKFKSFVKYFIKLINF